MVYTDGKKILCPVFRDPLYTDSTYDLVRPNITDGAERFTVLVPARQ